MIRLLLFCRASATCIQICTNLARFFPYPQKAKLEMF
jgi:hypothetical protein